MELRQLRYFVAVAEELHFGRAARRVHIAQPPFSQQIKGLEEEIGARLLERNSRKVRLTGEGRYFYKQALSILSQAEEAAATVARMAKGEYGNIKVGFMEIAMDSLLPEAVRSFRHRYPGVSVQLSQFGATIQLQRIHSGELDVGFSTVYLHAMEGLSSVKLFSKNHVLAVPEDHIFTGRDSISLEEIAGEQLIMFPRTGQPDLHDAIMEAFTFKGLTPVISQEVSGLSGASALIASGMGVTFLPENSRVSRKGITLVPLAEEFPSMDIYMVWNKEEYSNTAGVFMERVADYFSVTKSFADEVSS
ncbi:LysR family transcriptional regulator [Maridesulfovibrio hydrothermalis]|uniref:Transcriptional regulator, LysR family n=1 Tax=Maridesulfovibrio hydrothermalis AM13 = DSM 14728 TaxID=1121451 RepID=L0RC45_9BACT|nr:LysR substrate-binding domain-containing protein [Maridesulfovibrio hydrothermalis]CCO23792.1 Transcriptional regulator, LysR family [Maridesulfovibrio hydrothermalis AM13 = DSM 14728]